MKYNNLTLEKRTALNDPWNDTSGVIKRQTKIQRDRWDYLKEAEEQLSCKEMYKEVTDDLSYLPDVMHRTLEKVLINFESISMMGSPNPVNFIPYLKFIKGCIVFQVGPLSLTLVFMRKYLCVFRLLPCKSIAAKGY